MAKRVVRMESQQEIATVAKVKEARMSDLLAMIEVEKPEVIAKSLNERQLSFLIDTGAVHDNQRKRLEAEVKKIKAVLIEHAKINKWKTLAGENGTAVIKPATSNEIKPTDLLKKLVAAGKKHLFDTVFKVQKTMADEYLGKAEIADITDSKTEEYGSISLKVK